MSDAGFPTPATAGPAAERRTTDAHSPHGHRARRARTVLALASIGAPLVALGAWLPWLAISGYSVAGDQRQDYTFLLSPGDIEGALGTFQWSALTVAPLVLLPIVWWRSRPLVSRSALMLAAALVIAGAASLPFILPEGASIRLVPELYSAPLTITYRGPLLPGFWVAVFGAALLLSAAILALVLRVRPGDGSRLLQSGQRHEPQTSRALIPLPGAGALTLGISLWVFSTFLMPWASVNCSTTPLFVGACMGLPYTTVLRYGIADTTALVDPLASHFAIGTLLGGGAIIILVGLWLREHSLGFCGWATLWLTQAVAFAWLAEDGVGVVVARHDALGLQSGTWTGETAVLIALLASILMLIGLAYLWVDALRHRRA